MSDAIAAGCYCRYVLTQNGKYRREYTCKLHDGSAEVMVKRQKTIAEILYSRTDLPEHMAVFPRPDHLIVIYAARDEADNAAAILRQSGATVIDGPDVWTILVYP